MIDLTVAPMLPAIIGIALAVFFTVVSIATYRECNTAAKARDHITMFSGIVVGSAFATLAAFCGLFSLFYLGILG